MNRRGVLIGGLAGALAPGALAHAPGASTEGLIRRWLEPFMAANDFSGVVAMATDGREPVVIELGHADFAFRTPLTRHSRFGVESVSKLFTVEALKALRENGKLGLDDKLSKWLPDYPGADGITLRLLAQHRAGIARDLTDFQAAWPLPHTTLELVAYCAKIPAAGKPGATFLYSNNGYRLLARVIELAGGATYGEVVRETVLDPLGMHDTGEWSLTDIIPDLAEGATPGAGWRTLRRPPPCDMSNFRGAASYYSTVHDLLSFAAARQPKGAVSLKPRVSDGHDGRGHGFVSACYRYPVERTSIVFLGNIETGLFEQLKPGLEQIAFDGVAPKPRPPTETPPAATVSSDFPGTYDLFGGKFVIQRDDAGTYWADAGDGPQPLIPMGDNRMFFRLRYATLTLVRAGADTKLNWSEPSGEFSLKKLG